MKKRSILQVFYVLSWKKYRNTESFWQIADVWPPEGTNCSSFPKKLQTQPHCPKFLCHMLPQGPIYSLIIQSSLVLTIISHHLYWAKQTSSLMARGICIPDYKETRMHWISEWSMHALSHFGSAKDLHPTMIVWCRKYFLHHFAKKIMRRKYR